MTLSNGFWLTFMPRYIIAFSIGVPITVSLGDDFSSEKSFDGRSNDRSASPRSSRARRLPADGMMRMITRLILGIGPFFQSSLRA